MSPDHTVYDLGEVGATRADPNSQRGSSGPRPFVQRFKSQSTRPRGHGRRTPGAGLAGTLSLLLPGVGQIATGESAWGMFVMTTMGFAAAVSWAVLATFERLVATLELFNLPTEFLAVALVGLYVTAACAHVLGVLHAHATGSHDPYARGPHPFLTGGASALVPGWGQILNGARIRAASCLLACWTLGAAAILLAPSVPPALERLAAPLAGMVPASWRLGVLLGAAGVIWCLAVYDGVATAISRRRAYA